MENNRPFIGRNEELNTLENEFNRKASSFVIVYGRRRVGKTTLINEFLLKHKDNGFYFLATQESLKENLNTFRYQAASFLNNPLLKDSNADFETIFKLIKDYKKDEKKIIIMDEFQYLGKNDDSFPSLIQKIWDTILKNENIMLILCGSLISLMKKQTLDYSSPLYGRRTAQIKLKQISFKYYKDYFKNKNDKDLILFYSVTGGVPKYFESFDDSCGIYENIERNILDPGSYLFEEPVFLLQNEVSEIGSYFSLIRAIAFGNRKLSDISAFLNVKQTSLSKYLNTLIDLDIVERSVPITETNPEKSKSGLYKIKDNYISFWFRFVYPYRDLLERGEKKYVLEQIKKTFKDNYVSYIYEDIAIERVWQLSESGELKAYYDRIGKYWGPICGEIDILGIDSINKTFIIGECKYTESEKGLSLLNDLKKKSEKMEERFGYKCSEFIFFSTSGFSKGLMDEAKRNDSIILVDTLDLIKQE